jgi:hypothetical protein
LRGKLSIYGFIFASSMTCLRSACDFVSGLAMVNPFLGLREGPMFAGIVLDPQRTLAAVS